MRSKREEKMTEPQVERSSPEGMTIQTRKGGQYIVQPDEPLEAAQETAPVPAGKGGDDVNP